MCTKNVKVTKIYFNVFLLPVVTDIRVVETKYTVARTAIFLEMATFKPQTPIKEI